MLPDGYVLNAEGRRYTVIGMLGRGANAVAYLAECHQNNLTAKCILKEYSPIDTDDLDGGKRRFIDSGRRQNAIRQLSVLNNQTPPVSRIFEANGTAYIEVACYNGTTLDRLDTLTLPQYMDICRTIAKTVEYYHASGQLCLDLKPENIFVMQNAPDDTVTQLVEFIDFDAVRSAGVTADNGISYTRDWAAPELLDPYAAAKIGKTADIYTVGEIVFYLLFGRHSEESEHRGFSEYPFDECRRDYRRYTARPDIRGIFTRIFRGTIRSSASNRFKDIGEITKLLEQLVTELYRKDYIIPVLPSVSPDFVGRDRELKDISESLKSNPVLFLTGIGGIGKSTLVRNFIYRNKAEYDAIVYLEFDGDFKHTFADDMQLQISTVSRQDGESFEEYFARKLSHFKRICTDKRVLFIIDNFSGKVTKDLSRIIDSGYDTIIVTRNQPPKNSFAFMEIGAISDRSDIFRLITLNLGRPLTKAERLCFDEITAVVQGHTLVIELIARQTAAGRLDIHTALRLIKENGFSRFSDEKVGNYKDGEEVYDTLSAIISALFDASGMSADERLAMKILSLLDVRGLETSLIRKLFPDISEEVIMSLHRQGWLYSDAKVRVHSVIAETVRSWSWYSDDISVMEYHSKIIDIYSGMANDVHIRNVLREAELYRDRHPRHIITAMYWDMAGSYYDTLLNGNYMPCCEQEAELLRKMTDAMDKAIENMELSEDSRRTKYLAKYYLSLAGILIRSIPEYYDKAAELLDRANKLIDANEPQYSDERCYYCMVSAWYFTLAEPDIVRTKALTERAESIAEKVFPTDLEIIDIIHIPTANCYFYHNDFQSAAKKLEEAVKLCRRHFDMLPYADKQAELMNCLLDVYMELRDTAKCRELIAEIDHINETYKEQGIYREVDPEIREILNTH